MGFAGELSTIGLAEVFQNVAFNRLTGTLSVQDRSRQATVYFEQGKIRAVTPAEGGFDYPGIAVRVGAANEAAVAAVRRRRRRRKTVRTVLGEQGQFDAELYDQAVAAQVEEEAIQLFSWKLASFVFEEGRPPDGSFDAEQIECGVALDPQAVAMEAARRLDELDSINRLAVTDREIFVQTAEVDGELTEVQQHVLGWLDGSRDLGSIAEQIAAPRFQVLKEVAQLVEAGIVTHVTPTHLKEMAAKAFAAGDTERALRHLEAVLAREPGDNDARREILRMYERAGKKREAAREYKRLAAALQEEGDLKGALDAYERASVLVPYDTVAMEKVLEIHAQRGDRSALLRAGRQLAEAFGAQGMHEEAAQMYERLLAEDERSTALREALAGAYLKAHEPKKAAEQLLVLARHSFQRGKYEDALNFYRNVVAVDRECEEARDRIDVIESGRAQALRRTRRRRVLAAVFAVLAGFALWQGGREWLALEALHAAERATVSSLAQDPSDRSLLGSIERYARVCADYPHTLAATRATDTLRVLLLDQIQRLNVAAPRRSAAVDEALRRLERVTLPDELDELWLDARRHLIAAVESRAAGG